MNLNKAFIIGNLTRDPEGKALPSGNAVSNFSIATNRMWTDAQTKEKKKQTEFHNIVAFSKLAEICNQYLTKGKLVLIEGRLQTRSWEDADGNKKYKTEIVADNLQMGPKTAASGGGEPRPEESGRDKVEEIQVDGDTKDKKEKKEPSSAKATDGEEEIDVKDIPF